MTTFCTPGLSTPSETSQPARMNHAMKRTQRSNTVPGEGHPPQSSSSGEPRHSQRRKPQQHAHEELTSTSGARPPRFWPPFRPSLAVGDHHSQRASVRRSKKSDRPASGEGGARLLVTKHFLGMVWPGKDENRENSWMWTGSLKEQLRSTDCVFHSHSLYAGGGCEDEDVKLTEKHCECLAVTCWGREGS